MKRIGYLLSGAIVGGVSTYFITTESPTSEIPPEIATPTGLISPEQARTLDQAFDSRYTLISDSIVGRPDNRSSWYSLENVRNYLDYAEIQSDSLGYTMTGVRVYLGAHENVGEEVGYTTMFLIPTGYPNVSQGSSLSLKLPPENHNDVPGGSGLNDGEEGDPPAANYPQ